ncbi:hypothetical protein CTheo_6691 [Ceratobasidium theobromae]|uniref:Uncharacterized protein n=1 Tax=Ceratobasidium theobromae TaxID=1582974 RepID=A0A5N5QEH5_9AGAM|nr:hypothetical protein CTheo_6691 [Ceratobasidium theobromae]
MREVSNRLAAIDSFLQFLFDGELKPEQKGCITLRISFAALTALLGDFSMGQLPASDPNAPVVPDAYLKSFRHFHEPLTDILRQLSDKLEKSINMYRHRRSPSASLVIKFQGMLTTLKRWNDFLGDDTFAGPTKVVDTWLNHHPNQVNNKQRGSGYGEQSSPTTSDSHTSPGQYDSSLMSPMPAYDESLNRRSSPNNVRATGGSGTQAYDSLFHTVNHSSNVTFFPSAFNALGFSQDALSGMYAHFPPPSPGPNQGSFHTTGYGNY